MHTGTQRKYVIKPINRLADGRPAQRVVKKVIPLLDCTAPCRRLDWLVNIDCERG